MMTRPLCGLLAITTLAFCGCAKCCESDSQPAGAISVSEAVTLQPIKLDKLEGAIKKHVGKVVLMDFWGTFCVPCKKEFPRLVKLHEEHAKDGLICISLSVDEKEDAAQALAFLKSAHADFANYLIDERAMVWQDHFRLKGVPAVFIWDRTGKQVARFDGDDPDKQFTYEEVEQKVLEVLRN